MMKSKLYILSAFLLLALGGCNEIDVNDRFIDYNPGGTVVPGEIEKWVLLEEFTGQLCPNCPQGAAEAQRLKETYDNKVVLVGIHAGGFAQGSAFVTEAGNAYWEKFYANGDQLGYPAAMTDRTLFSGNRVSTGYQQEWSQWVKSRMDVQPNISFNMKSKYNSTDRSITVTSKIKTDVEVENIKILLMLTESHIIAYQANGGNEYEHNHVLRGVIGDKEGNYWGDAVTISTTSETSVVSANYKLNDNWNPENMHIVGVIYNATTDEVLQVREIPLMNEGETGGKRVLIEEFTGQLCPNCPQGSAEAQRLKETYDNEVILVGVHAGGFAQGSAFVTDAGNAYWEKFYANGDQLGYPAAMIDRALFSGNRVSTGYQQEWSQWVSQRFNVPNSISLRLKSDYDNENRTLVVTSKVKSTTLVENTNLLLMLTESHIIGYQANGGNEYEHNHVLRGVIGDKEKNYWGSEIVISSEEETSTASISYELPADWKPENMNIVGVVYDRNTDEVLQVTEIPLVKLAK